MMDKMKTFLKKLFLEPLVHFFFLAFILFLFLSEEKLEIPSQMSEVSSLENIDKNSIKNEYRTIYKKEPNRVELEVYIKKKVYENSLINKAIELKIHENNLVIKKLLLNKVKQIESASVLNNEIGEDRLKEYYIEHIEDYSKKNSISFYQIHFSEENATYAPSISEMLGTLKVEASKAKYFGDTVSKQDFLKGISPDKLVSHYGKYFTHKILRLRSGVWNKPIRSKDGVYITYIVDVNSSTAYEFEEVQERVYEDYKNEILREVMSR